jgi:hypothetical protein
VKGFANARHQRWRRQLNRRFESCWSGAVESHIPGFPVEFGGVGDLRAAFFKESRTRGRCLAPRAGNPGSRERRARYGPPVSCGKTGSCTSRVVIPPKPKDGLNGAPIPSICCWVWQKPWWASPVFFGPRTPPRQAGAGWRTWGTRPVLNKFGLSADTGRPVVRLPKNMSAKSAISAISPLVGG